MLQSKSKQTTNGGEQTIDFSWLWPKRVFQNVSHLCILTVTAGAPNELMATTGYM